MKHINANCHNATTSPVLVLDGPPAVRYTGVLESPERCVFDVPDTATGGATIEYGDSQTARLVVPPSPGFWEAGMEPVNMQPPVLDYRTPVQKLNTYGRDFLLNGSRWLWKGSSDFRAYEYFLQDRDLTPIYQQRRDCGANLLRVFGMYNGGIGRFIPADYGQAYWDGWVPFLRQAASHGFQIEVTMFADMDAIPMNQQVHWGMFGDVVRDEPNVLSELANEYKKNGVDPGKFSVLPNTLCSRGSGLSDEAGYLPGWHYHTWHGRRDWPKVLFSAEDMWYVGEGYGWDGKPRPVVHDEPIGFAEFDQPGRRSADPYVARVLGQTASAYGAGGTFHSDMGIQSFEWGPITELCARTFYAAMG